MSSELRFLVLCLLVACAQGSSAPPEEPPAAAPTIDAGCTPDCTSVATSAADGGEPSVPLDAGATPTSAPNTSTAQCRMDADCDSILRRELSVLSRPPPPRDYTQALCVRGDIAEDSWGFGGDSGEPSCLCGPDNVSILLSSTSPRPCLHVGRGARCLYKTAEFPGCDLAQPDTSCKAVCAVLHARIEADAKSDLPTELRSARCEYGNCRGVVRIGDACFETLSGEPLPCGAVHDDARDE